ncbi:ester cyclase [Ferruginibacter lapsinanis]|uniref:ester cyclase n=1 Tax=Ferruginibacter lapsinanis TaxID=563172 RepID=UPI001E60F178|nr:ester cyclase [Ferruginibacter lapsinanis]UEG49032.1 ester cyclase [Ferruginibacter lapsinanis]
MSTNEVLKLNDQIIDAWNMHNDEKFINLCDENVIWKVSRNKETYRGKKEVRAYFNNWNTAFPDVKLKVISRVITDDAITVEYEITGKHDGNLHFSDDMPEIPPTHRKLDSFGCYVAKVKNGKVFETHLYPDRLGLVEQLGLEDRLMHQHN